MLRKKTRHLPQSPAITSCITPPSRFQIPSPSQSIFRVLINNHRPTPSNRFSLYALNPSLRTLISSSRALASLSFFPSCFLLFTFWPSPPFILFHLLMCGVCHQTPPAASGPWVGFLVAYLRGVDKLPSKVLCGTKGAIEEDLDLKRLGELSSVDPAEVIGVHSAPTVDLDRSREVIHKLGCGQMPVLPLQKR